MNVTFLMNAKLPNISLKKTKFNAFLRLGILYQLKFLWFEPISQAFTADDHLIAQFEE